VADRLVLRMQAISASGGENHAPRLHACFYIDCDILRAARVFCERAHSSR